MPGIQRLEEGHGIGPGPAEVGEPAHLPGRAVASDHRHCVEQAEGVDARLVDRDDDRLALVGE